MAKIDFLINRTGFDYDLKLGGSGLAFFGAAGFGSSVEVGKYQGTTFVSDGAGTVKGAQALRLQKLFIPELLNLQQVLETVNGYHPKGLVSLLNLLLLLE